jgi:hypothetical protein
MIKAMRFWAKEHEPVWFVWAKTICRPYSDIQLIQVLAAPHTSEWQLSSLMEEEVPAAMMDDFKRFALCSDFRQAANDVEKLDRFWDLAG